jgi:hypothetical protein
MWAYRSDKDGREGRELVDGDVSRQGPARGQQVAARIRLHCVDPAEPLHLGLPPALLILGM